MIKVKNWRGNAQNIKLQPGSVDESGGLTLII
jgi:hypothetical protein